jgi:hypothetical protein
MADNAWKHDAGGYYVEMRKGGTKDYSLDWADWLGADTVAGAALDVPTGLALASTPAVNGKVVQFVIIAGAAGNYVCKFTLTSAAGLVEPWSFRVLVTD